MIRRPKVEAGTDPEQPARLAGPVLCVRKLVVTYSGREVPAVRGIDLEVSAGEVVALVGESGSGKSTIAHSVIGLLPRNGRVEQGEIVFAGEDITHWGERKFRGIRGAGIGFVPQDPTLSLDPVKRIGDQVAEALVVHGRASRRAAMAAAVEILERVGLSEPQIRARQFPHQLSGGMRQRVLIGIATACRPRLIVADEPTSNLDVTVQRRILDSLAELTRQDGTAMLLITHDLGVASDRADRVVVLQQGGIVESGPVGQVIDRPRAAYTRKLLAAAPSLGVRSGISASDRAPVTGGEGGHGGQGGGGGEQAPAILEARNLRKRYRVSGPGGQVITAVEDVSFAVRRGQTFGLVGESGSGKSVTSRLVLRLEQPTQGEVWFEGENITAWKGEPLRLLRRHLQVVYQNPYASLDPRLSLGDIISEPLQAFQVGDKLSQRRRAAELLEQVALPKSYIERRPVELSGGQRQRVAIARALALKPHFVVLDEPVSALDVSVQAQILTLLQELKSELNLSYLFISHDLAVIRQICDDIAVMQRGVVVEQGSIDSVFGSPADPYTRDLLDAIPGGMRASVGEA
jgi:peptide/nickel transport system ATP-binding protein